MFLIVSNLDVWAGRNVCQITTTAISPSCFGQNNGSLTATYNEFCECNGTIFYWKLISNFVTIQTATSTSNTITFSGLGAGNY
jgi:hypothetical protein